MADEGFMDAGMGTSPPEDDPMDPSSGQDPLERVAEALLPFVGPDGYGEGTDRMRRDNSLKAAAAALAAVERSPQNVRRIRHDGIPHGIRDACSECADVAWEECFLNGQCRNYVVPVERPPVAQQDQLTPEHARVLLDGTRHLTEMAVGIEAEALAILRRLAASVGEHDD